MKRHALRMLQPARARRALTFLAASIVFGGLVRLITDQRGVDVALQLPGAEKGALHLTNALDASRLESRR
ncbi:MAG: hypothetical protein EXR75_16485 [Myxococcales bacterium]|nr:hypothetical protein [Myxococcales bacterium]